MAITQISIPSSPTLAYQPIMFKLESDDTTIVNLVIEVAISEDGGVTENRVSATSVSPDLGTVDEFTFDIQEVIKKHVSFKLKTLGSSTVLNDVDNIQFRIKAYEVVLTAGLLVTTYDAANANNTNFQYHSPAFASFNWRESHFNLATFDENNYQLNGITKEFLSESPTTKDIELGANEFLGMAWTVSTGGVKNYLINILTYNNLGALLNTDNLSFTDWNTFVVNSLTKPYLDIPVGTANLIAMGISLTNVAKYTIQLISDDGIRSEVKSYNIVNGCPSDARIHFINKFGKQDSITLKGNQTEGITYKSDIYQKALSTTYLASDFGRSVIHNELERNFTAYSKSIGRDVLNFANTMLVTRTAWIEINNNYFSILIDEGSKLVRNEGNMPIQFVLNFSLANNEKGHKA
tara:strand:+ start:1360 stop:2580 length:1221 start_codon:yes stop_codon:yes gene_type:complete